MFDSILERAKNMLADAFADAVERGLRRGFSNFFGASVVPPAPVIAGPADVDDEEEAEDGTHAPAKRTGRKARA